MIPLGDLLSEAGLPLPPGADPTLGVQRVVHDSRAAGPASVFTAIAGGHADGHEFAADAVRRGSVAVVAERPLPGLPSTVPVVLVADSRRSLGPLAAAAAGHPSRDLTVVGITGTDGKTLTTTLLWAAWGGAGIPAGSLTTVDFRTGRRVVPNRTRQTTLEAPDVQERLAAARAAGCTHVALETSSHALELHRVSGVCFRAAVYTRITSEHLELHGSRERYLAAKSRLVAMVAERPDGIAVLDRDDDFAYAALAAVPVARRLTYSAAGAADADLAAQGAVAGATGTRFIARTPWGSTEVPLRLRGLFNVGNALAAIAAACSTGASLGQAVDGLVSLERVSGRMEVVDLGQPFGVVIDYAHTAQALHDVLTELRRSTAGLLWAVFGSAGERDRSKREPMGRVASELADVVVITDEDPRGEDREAIVGEIARGAGESTASGGAVHLIPDRSEAIGFAIDRAAPGDTVLLAGKGHESTLLRGGASLPWDERAVVERALRRRHR